MGVHAGCCCGSDVVAVAVGASGASGAADAVVDDVDAIAAGEVIGLQLRQHLPALGLLLSILNVLFA
jgi:hypothetical protein